MIILFDIVRQPFNPLSCVVIVRYKSTRSIEFKKKTIATCINDEITLEKLMLLLHFTKSLKQGNIDILYLTMPEEHNCLTPTSYLIPKLRCRAHALKIDPSPTFTESLKVTILIDCVYGC